jgi:putative membrane protein
MLSTYAGTLVAHPGWGPGPGWGGPGWWIIFPILWFALIVTVIVLLARRARRGWAAWGPYGPHRGTGPDPVAVLGERYARGEIDEAEYRTRLAVLQPEPPRR